MIVALDTETTLAGNREPIPRLVSVAIANDEGVDVLAAHDPRLSQIVLGALAGDVALANAPFDLFVLWRAWPAIWPAIHAALVAGRIHDVLTREKLIDIADGRYRQRGGYDLGSVAARRTGIWLDKSDPWRLRYGTLLGREIVDWPAAALQYAQLDAWATWRTFVAQRDSVAPAVLADAPAQARAHIALYAMTIRGVHTDPDRVAALDRLLTTRIAHLEERAIQVGLARQKYKVKRPSPVQRDRKAVQTAVAEWCRTTGRATPRNDLTSKAAARGDTEGSIAISKAALDEIGIPRGRWVGDQFCDEKDQTKLAHPIDVYRELGGIRALYSKNIPVLRHPVIRTRYDELVSSGRTSASGFRKIVVPDADPFDDDDLAPIDLDPADEWVGTNTQNFSREGGWRECLIPPPGKRFGGTDYSALELVTLAQVQLDWLGRSTLATMLRAGKDPHRAFAAEHLLRIPYDAFEKSKHNDSRQLAKAWNFGKPGGMGEQRFIAWAQTAYGVSVTPEEHRRIDALYHAAFPEIRLYWQRIKTMQTGYDQGPIYTITQPRSGRIRGGCRFPDAANTPFQGLGADVAKLAAWLLFCAGLDPASPLYGCYQVLFEHDAFVTVIDQDPAHIDWPKGTATAAAGSCRCRGCTQLAEQERIMIYASSVLCPDVPMRVESWIDERYRK